jgi:uncharacterized protein YbbK (DUF523 family)
MFGINKALLKSRSPACGKGEIYDGSFTGTLKRGNGALAELLINEGLEGYSEDEIDKLI